MSERKICVWYQGSDEDWDVWETACGQRWQFSNDTGPVGNGMKFCCYCGLQLKEVKYIDY